jgi:hypothetical protein
MMNHDRAANAKISESAAVHQVPNGFVRRATRTAEENPLSNKPLNIPIRRASFAPPTVMVMNECRRASADKLRVKEMIELAI